MDKTESAASTYHLENSSALLPDDAAYQLQREAELWQFLSQLTHHLASFEDQLAKLTATQEDIEPKWLLRVRDRLDSQGFLELAQESLKFTSTALHHVQQLTDKEVAVLERPGTLRQTLLLSEAAAISKACDQLAAVIATSTSIAVEKRATLLKLYNQLANGLDVRSISQFVQAVAQLAPQLPEINDIWVEVFPVVRPFIS